jgi:hypothetical protein
MRILIIIFSALIMFAFASTIYPSGSSSMLDEVNKQIAERPDDPQLYQARAVLLMELGRRNEGYEAAKQAMAAHIKAKDNVVWFGLERIDLGNFFVSSIFNMAEAERAPPSTGIIRPLTFRLFKKSAVPIAGIIDYEVGMIDGKPVSAAFRERDGKTFLNFDSMNKVSEYEDIRKIALNLVESLYLTHSPVRQRGNGFDDGWVHFNL